MVSRRDLNISLEDRALCSQLAGEIASIARDLVQAFGADVTKEEAEPGEFMFEYEDSRVHVVWKGPRSLPSDLQYKIFVFRKRPFVPKGCGGWPPVIWQFNSSPATLECDSEVAKGVLEHLRRVWSLPCHCCGIKKPDRVGLGPPCPGWVRLETNLTDVAAPEKFACSRECVERLGRRVEK